MNELIKTITRDDGTIAVSGRELHDFLGVGKDFSNWFKDMASYGFEEGKDFSPFSAKTPNGGILAAEKLAAKRGHQIDDTQKQRITTIQ